ncbi:hypothetical protein FGO68_gene9398 [Halteria grandinella]|uniref:Uncharacterized protein n=1 Tax=Halteria grandinella TaxID=5974 RepID=A0A8J8SYU2_HALGN|nr:hypothetical protein FGO68_gene9398 [Halteria grandinella]
MGGSKQDRQREALHWSVKTILYCFELLGKAHLVITIYILLTWVGEASRGVPGTGASCPSLIFRWASGYQWSRRWRARICTSRKCRWRRTQYPRLAWA